VTFTDEGLHQAKLPVKHGGIGVLSASDLALPAFLASVFISKTATIIIDATWWNQRRQLQILYGHMTVDQPDINTRFVDRCRSENMESSSIQVIAAEAMLPVAQTPSNRARLIAAAAPSSGASLQVIPMSSVGNLTTHPCALPCLYVWMRHCAHRMTVSVEWLSIQVEHTV